MKLLYQTHSPYARKALVFALEAGIPGLEVIHHETSPTLRNDEVFAQNPLGKVPVLLRDGAEPLIDSDVICACLDTLHNGTRLIPADGEARWLALNMQAVAQGIAAAGIAVRWETVRRPGHLRYDALRDGHTAKLLESYRWLEERIDTDAPIHIGHIAVATALDWLEFRGLPSFRDGCPRLSAWLDVFSQRPSMLATPLAGETHDA